MTLLVIFILIYKIKKKNITEKKQHDTKEEKKSLDQKLYSFITVLLRLNIIYDFKILSNKSNI